MQHAAGASTGDHAHETAWAPGAVVVSAADVAAIRRWLTRLDPTLTVGRRHAPDGPTDAAGEAAADLPSGGHGLTQAQCIDLLRELEDLEAAAAGAQAVITAHLAAARHDVEQAAGVPRADRGRGLAGEVALARRVSPHRGGQHLGLGRTLATDMLRTLAALRRGVLSEWRATLLVRESICLSTADRRAFDDQLVADPGLLGRMGDRRLVAEAKKVAYRLDARSIVARAARAENHRCVTIRPAPDTMAYLTALLPVVQAVAAQASLIAASELARATGDARNRGEVMADTLVARLTGTSSDVPADVHLQLVMTDHTLLAHGDEPAHLTGHGTVPPAWARDLIQRALTGRAAAPVRADEVPSSSTGPGSGTGVWLRRLFTDNADQLIAMDSRQRHAPPGLAHYITTRDAGICRTPWCDARIRHIDHITDHHTGGPTNEHNLQGLCERCNYTKIHSGWRASATTRADPARSHAPAAGSAPPEPGGPSQHHARAGPEVSTRTPTGHTYHSSPPRLPRAG